MQEVYFIKVSGKPDILAIRGEEEEFSPLPNSDLSTAIACKCNQVPRVGFEGAVGLPR